MNQILDDIFAIDLLTGESVHNYKLPFRICAHASVLVRNSIYIIGGTDGG